MTGPDAYRAAVDCLRRARVIEHGIAHTDLLREANAYAALAGAAATAASLNPRSPREIAETKLDWENATQSPSETEDP